MIRLLVALSFALASCEPSDMGLPLTREETATPANPVSSNTTNAIQDCIVGAKHGEKWVWVSPIAAVKTSGATDATRTIGTGLKATATSVFALPLHDIPVGSRIKALRARYRGANAGAGTLELFLIWPFGDSSDDEHFSDPLTIDDGDTNAHTSAIFTFDTPIAVVGPDSVSSSAAASPGIEIDMRNNQQVFSVGYLIDFP